MKLSGTAKKIKAELKEKGIKSEEVLEIVLVEPDTTADAPFLAEMTNLRRYRGAIPFPETPVHLLPCVNMEELELESAVGELDWLASFPKLESLVMAKERCVLFDSMPHLPKLHTFLYGSADYPEFAVESSIFERLPNLRTLRTRVEATHSLEFLKFLPRLESLCLLCDKFGAEKPTADLSALSVCENLTELKLIGFEKVADFTPLSSLVKLKKLVLMGCGRGAEASIEPIGKLRQLKHLTILRGGSIKGYDHLSNLNDLEQLTIEHSGEQQLRGIDFVCGMKHLKHLSVAGNGSVNNLEPLRYLVGLKHLNISGVCDKLKGVSALSALSGLEELVWEGCPNIAHLKGVEAEALRVLRVPRAKRMKDLGAISHLTSLEELNAGCTELKNLEKLGCFPKLRIAFFDECEKLDDLSGIESCNLLEELDISNCTLLYDLSLISKLESLSKLCVGRDEENVIMLPRAKNNAVGF